MTGVPVFNNPTILFFLVVFVFFHCSIVTSHFEVVGFAECSDCSNLNPSLVFSGLHVTINCKLKRGGEVVKRIGRTKLDHGGKFKLSLPYNMLDQRQHRCYAQLHSPASALPCTSSAKLELVCNKRIFAPAKPIRFSAALCSSKFLWPFHKYPPLPTIPLLPPLPPLFKHKPPRSNPPPRAVVVPRPPPIPAYGPPHH